MSHHIWSMFRYSFCKLDKQIFIVLIHSCFQIIKQLPFNIVLKRLMHCIFLKLKITILYLSLYVLDTCRLAVKLQTIWYGKRKMLKLLLRATKKETQTIPTYLRRAIIRKPHVIKGNIISMPILLHFSYLNFMAS